MVPVNVFLSITDRGFEILLLKIASKLNIAFVRKVQYKFSGMQDLSFFRGDNRDLKTSVGRAYGTLRNETKRNETVLCETVLCEMVLCEMVLCETVLCRDDERRCGVETIASSHKKQTLHARPLFSALLRYA